jgi:hypothetical protein
MPLPINDPRYWRDLARITLAEAKETADKRLRDRLRRVAKGYHRLAEWTSLHSASPMWNAELIYGRKPRTIVPPPHD